MQTILIAGGAGFIGSNLCESLLPEFKVICVDNLITGEKKNIEELLKNPNFKFLEMDITRPREGTDNEFLNINYIFHLASPASPNKKSKRSYVNFPIETLLVNSIGTYNLLELAKERNAKFLYASSSEIYGDPAISPQNEEYFGNVNPNGIRSVYDEGKRFGEAITMAYYRKYNLDTRIVRIFNTYGPKMRADDGRVISNFINQALSNQPITVYGDGSQTRSCCYVDDMVDGLKRAMFAEKAKGEVINIGNQDLYCRGAAYGKFVVIKHSNNLTTLYGHMSGFAVSLGSKVERGQTIGYIGRTGWATGPHLHFTVFSSQTLSPARPGFPEGAIASRVCGPMPVGGDLDPTKYL